MDKDGPLREGARHSTFDIRCLCCRTRGQSGARPLQASGLLAGGLARRMVDRSALRQGLGGLRSESGVFRKTSGLTELRQKL